LKKLDPRLRGDDEIAYSDIFYDTIFSSTRKKMNRQPFKSSGSAAFRQALHKKCEDVDPN
jgi:hypothetical protein